MRLILLALLLMAAPAQAADTAAIPLSCSGPGLNASEGFIVNLADQTVTGFGFVAHIDTINDGSISFSAEVPELAAPGMPIGTTRHTGTIDRITGTLSLEGRFKSAVTRFLLVCKPANRLF